MLFSANLLASTVKMVAVCRTSDAFVVAVLRTATLTPRLHFTYNAMSQCSAIQRNTTRGAVRHRIRCDRCFTAINEKEPSGVFDSSLLGTTLAENAGVENAGVENTGAKTYGKPLEQKIKIRIN